MPTIPEVSDEQIFINKNKYTNAIKGKKLRKRLFDNGIKVKIHTEYIPTLTVFNRTFTKEILVYTFTKPSTLDKDLLNDIIMDIEMAIERKYDIGSAYFRYEDV